MNTGILNHSPLFTLNLLYSLDVLMVRMSDSAILPSHSCFHVNRPLAAGGGKQKQVDCPSPHLGDGHDKVRYSVRKRRRETAVPSAQTFPDVADKVRLNVRRSLRDALVNRSVQIFVIFTDPVVFGNHSLAFLKIVFSVPVQSYVYNVKRTGDLSYRLLLSVNAGCSILFPIIIYILSVVVFCECRLFNIVSHHN